MMLTEAVDGTLTAGEQATFDLHLAGCATCMEMLADAKRGAAWMQMLRQHRPEPPAAMLERILAQTSRAQTSGAQSATTAGVGMDAGLGLAMGPAGVLEPVAGAMTQSNVLPFQKRVVRRFDLRAVGHTLLQPRLAMTAAMAFFSIALTLNLTGVRLSDFQVSDLKPSSLKRSIYTANAHVVRYYTNLRVVYELESRVHDLQRSSDDEPAATLPQTAPAKDGAGGDMGGTDPAGKKKVQEPEAQPKRHASPGTSRREPLHDDLRVLASGRAGSGGSEIAASTMIYFATLTLPLDLPGQERGTV